MFLIFSVVSLLVSLYSIIIFIIDIINSNKNQTKYQRNLKKILRQYDSYITESSTDIDTSGKTTIEIKSFKELLDVRKNIEKAIIFIRLNDKSSKFLIVDQNQIYLYRFDEK